MSSNMAHFDHSTHFRNWIFSRENLKLARQLCCSKVCTSLSASWVENAGVMTNAMMEKRHPRSFACLIPHSSNATSSSSADDDISTSTIANQEPMAQIDFLTLDEEALLNHFYEQKVVESCGQLFRTSDKVKSSAVLLYKRFYLSNSVQEFHPKFIVPTVIYIAGKVEEQYINVDTIAEGLKVDLKQIIRHEMVVLSGVRFQMIVYHPYRALFSYLEDSREKANEALSVDLLQKMHAQACILINDLLLSDIPLLYPPSVIALFAFRRATKEVLAENSHVIFDVDQYIQSHGECPEGQFLLLAQHFERIEETLTLMKTQQATSDPKVIKGIYKKLKQFYPAAEKNNDKVKEPKKKKQKKDKSA